MPLLRQPQPGAVLVFFATATLGCSLQRTPLFDDCGECFAPDVCELGRCIQFDGGMDAMTADDAGPADAPTPMDARDAANDVADDAGLDAGACSDGVLSPGESDVDCGGACTACGACASCRTAADCLGAASCVEGRCAATLSRVDTGRGTTVDAFVRADGAVLLAHYGPGAYHPAYDPSVPQAVTTRGAGPVGAGFAPDPCVVSGHLPFAQFDPAGHVVELACGESEMSAVRVASDSLFTTFAPGDHGVPGTVGSPGWANISAIGSGLGRGFFGVCGTGTAVNSGGIGYCTGPTAADGSTHLVSFTSGPVASYMGCAGTTCSGARCTNHVWVWLLP
jgi:hypothetical protein